MEGKEIRQRKGKRGDQSERAEDERKDKNEIGRGN